MDLHCRAELMGTDAASDEAVAPIMASASPGVDLKQMDVGDEA